MPHRTFRDPDGAEWHAWDTYPAVGAAGHATVAADYAGGWLCFERAAPTSAATAPEKRRVAPPPAGWADLPETALRAVLAEARAVAPRRPRAPADDGGGAAPEPPA